MHHNKGGLYGNPNSRNDTDPVGRPLLPHQRCARGPRRPAPTRGGDTLARPELERGGGRGGGGGGGRATSSPPPPPRHTWHQRCRDQPDLIPNCVLTIEMSTGCATSLT